MECNLELLLVISLYVTFLITGLLKAFFEMFVDWNFTIGTGKSSIVCALCVGLGEKPSTLGRAKEVTI